MCLKLFYWRHGSTAIPCNWQTGNLVTVWYNTSHPQAASTLTSDYWMVQKVQAGACDSLYRILSQDIHFCCFRATAGSYAMMKLDAVWFIYQTNIERYKVNIITKVLPKP